jgi:ABC-type antimicrobial peptide transport system permease subunit
MPGVIAAIDPEQAITRARLMTELVGQTIGPQRFATRLLAAFAVAALLLATLGIFGLVSYTTGQRTRELGIRFALGSSPEGVIFVVMREGMRLLGVGLATGLVGAVFVGRAIAGRVAGAASFDPLVFGSIFAILALVGTLASFLPALRAIRIPPAVALRYE